MPTLHLTQIGLGANRHRVLIDLDDDGAKSSASAEFEFALSEQDREDLRWYLEDYLLYPIDPAPTIAQRIERRMGTLGAELCRHLFDSSPAARGLWARLLPQLPSTCVEVASEVDAASVLPWELLRDPQSNTSLAVFTRAFVRTQTETGRPATKAPPTSGGEKIRVLLVISRPGGGEDVPFRSVASHLVRLSADAREKFQLDVLRPATFEKLASELRRAAREGTPYHVVHFDGHGIWMDLADLAGHDDSPDPTTGGNGGGGGRRWDPHRFHAHDLRDGAHGYVLFEHPTAADNSDFVGGPSLGNLLAETGVPVLVLNACQSAHADLTTAPATMTNDEGEGDVQARVRAYGSFAQEVVNAGVAGVVAMRYIVYVVTAAQFIGDLYAALLDGQPLGEAVTLGRKQLRENPDREIAFTPRPLQDWVVPIVYEAAPLTLFEKPHGGPSRIRLDQAEAGQERAVLDPSLPAAPDVGFFGRDETLLALDRAFDTHQVVLLHAYAGAGKTSTAVEFAPWYQLTGGVKGPVLFTSFEQHLPLARVLDQLGTAFEPVLEAGGIHWLTLTDQERYRVALQLLQQIPVLWIWGQRRARRWVSRRD